jgi:uncharacterized repeat protein (TIGR01451 family)
MKKLLLLLLVLFSTTFININAQVSPVALCDTDLNQVETFNLEALIPQILNGQDPQNFNVTFYGSGVDAENDINPIANPTSFTTSIGSHVVFARVYDLQNNTFEIHSFIITVYYPPFIDVPDLEACFNQGVAYFDLGSVAETIWVQNSATPNTLSVNFYYSMSDAMNNVNPLPYNFATQDNSTVLYINATNLEAGCNNISSITLHAINCATPCYAPTNLSVSSVTNTSALLNWSSLNSGVSYDIYLCPSGSPSPTQNTTPTTISTTNQSMIVGLTCGTSYSVYVRANCNVASTSEWVGPYSFQTTDCNTNTCYPPSNVAITSTTTTTATVNWVAMNNETIWEVYVIASNGQAPTQGTTGMITNANPFVISNLICNTSYDVYVRATCDLIESTWVGPFAFQTASCTSFITVNNNYTPAQLVNEILLSNTCATGNNFVTQGNCGIGYFNNNNGDFPFEEGLIIRSGTVASSVGPYNSNTISSSCSQIGDSDLTNIMLGTGQTGTITDVTSLKFNFTAETNLLTFNFLFASNEYGSYQCSFSDVFGFVLTDLVTGAKQNIAVVPGTSTPISTTTIRNNLYNSACVSMNSQFFDSYNVNDPQSEINFRGQTVPMTANALLVPNHQYSLKLAVGDYQDSMFDSAVFIEGGSFAFGYQCQDNIQLVAFIDENNNGIKDTNELNYSQGTFNYTINNSGNEIVGQSSNGVLILYPENLTYSFDINFSVYPELNSYFSNSTSFSDIVFENGGNNIYYFPITNLQPYNDVEVTITSFQSPVPGFSYYNTIIYKNNGITPASGTLQFNHDSALSISNISQTGTTPIANGFTYNYTNLLPGETRAIYVYLTVPTIPTVNLGQTIVNSISSTNTGDINPSNNSLEFSQVVVGSFDPNDKLESHGGKIAINDFDENDYLTYTIRFQNTGTANAQFVTLVDALDSRLDETSIRMVNSSHNYTLTRTNTNLVWIFDHINLPPSIVNEVSSHGYVTFKIKPKPGYAVGDIIPNTAEIYFDYNPAIVTNTFNTEFVQSLSNVDFNENSISLNPNPAKDYFTINNIGNEKISGITIYEISGKKVFETKKSFENQINIDVSNFARGIYLVEIVSENKSKLTKKLILK